MIHIFSDGACFGNPGPGAYATLIVPENGEEKILRKYFDHTTNNQMEMMGVIAGLEYFSHPIRATLTTDSQYVVKGVQEWLPKWIKNHWRSSVTKAPIKNLDLWKRIHALNQHHDITFHWVRGHVGHPENERCNDLAQQLIKTHLKSQKS